VLIQERSSTTASAVNRFRESDPGGTSANHHIGIALGRSLLTFGFLFAFPRSEKREGRGRALAWKVVQPCDTLALFLQRKRSER
jgi:hypothetical protein